MTGLTALTLLVYLYAEHFMRRAGLLSYKLGSRLLGRNINNLRYADETTLKAESEGEFKSLLMRVKEESEKAWLELNIQKTKVIASLHGKQKGKK